MTKNLISQLKNKHKGTRKKLLVPEFDTTGEGNPIAVFYYSQTPRHFSEATRITKDYDLKGDDLAFACALLLVQLVDEDDKPVFAEGEFKEMMAFLPLECVNRLATELAEGYNIDEAVADAKKN